MLYGFRDGSAQEGFYLVVSAAESLAAYDALEPRVGELGGRRPAAFEHLTDDRLRNMLHAYLFEADTEQAITEVVETLQVEILHRNRALDKQRGMMSAEEADPYRSNDDDSRTIEEIYGLDTDDRWDKRTDEQIEQDKAYKQLADEAKKKGELTGDSFSGGKNRKKKDEVRVTDIRTSINADGSVQIDDVLATKGLYGAPKDIGNKAETPVDPAVEARVEEALNGLKAAPGLLPHIKTLAQGGDEIAAEAVRRYEAEIGSGDTGVGAPPSTNAGGASSSLPSDKADMLFTTGTCPAMFTSGDTVWVAFAPRDYWEAHSAIPDRHLQEELAAAYGPLPIALDELAENNFGLVDEGSMTEQQVINALTSFGFTYVPDMLGQNGGAPGEDEDDDVEDEDDDASPYAEEEDESDGDPTLLFALSGEFDIAPLVEALGHDADEIALRGPGWFTTQSEELATLLAVSLRRRGVAFQVFVSANKFTPNVQRTQMIFRGPFAMFFRLDLKDMNIEDALAALTSNGIKLESTLVGRGETLEGAWLGCTVERLAQKVEGVIKSVHPNVETEIYAVNPQGERIAPRGVHVVDPNSVKEVGPRPWNDRADEWHAMTDEEKSEEIKRGSTDEFIFTGSYEEGQGSQIFITPASYFEANGEMWEGDLHPWIELRLPNDVKKTNIRGEDLGNGVYRSVLDYDHLTYNMCQRGFKESMKMRLWLNANQL